MDINLGIYMNEMSKKDLYDSIICDREEIQRLQTLIKDTIKKVDYYLIEIKIINDLIDTKFRHIREN